MLLELEIEKINFEDFLKLLENVWQVNDSLMELKEAMNALDSKSNGYLTVEELRHILLETGECLDEHDFKEIIKAVEVQPDGTINNEGCIFIYLFFILIINFLFFSALLRFNRTSGFNFLVIKITILYKFE